MVIHKRTGKILEHVRQLAENIGPRGSTTTNERRASIYVLSVLKKLGLTKVGLEEFRGHPSTYQPYILAFLAALAGTATAWLFPDWRGFILVVMGAFPGAGGMLIETNLDSSWMRKALPRRKTQNVVATVPAKNEAKNKVVLCGHLDTHRTPIFYSSKTWGSIFSFLVTMAFLSMVTSILIGLVGLISGWLVLRWLLFIPMAFELLALLLCLQGEFTPFNPGANDNASGVGVCLAMAEELQIHPLKQTEVWFAFTDCEETGCDGMKHFLNDHGAELGENAVYIILDEVGYNAIKYLSSDGLIVKHPSHPKAIELIQAAQKALPGISIESKVGQAYTDALVATKYDKIAITLVSMPSDPNDAGHWHQMSDTVEHLDLKGLENALAVTQQLVNVIDGQVIEN
jgi:hypothetical protein